MSLPERPLTRRELYLAKAAGQDVTLPEEDLTREEQYLRAISEGGGGGGVTPEYVAEAIAEAKTDIEAEIPTKTSDLTNDSGYAAIDDTTAAQNKTYSSAKVEEKVAGEEITTTATGSDLTISTSSGNLNALTVYGKSEVVDGAIKSAGEGYAVVDLGTLTWDYSTSSRMFRTYINDMKPSSTTAERIQGLLCGKYELSSEGTSWDNLPNGKYQKVGTIFGIKDTDYTDATAFKNSLNGVLLAYELADPTQGNTIAIKTDNRTSTDGTMAVFTTGTPLRGIPNTDVKDVMEWDGSSGEVTKNCVSVDLGTATYAYDNNNKWFYTTSFASTIKPTSDIQQANILSSIYTPNTVAQMLADQTINMACATNRFGTLFIRNTDYTDPADFTTAMSGVKLVYELATPTTTQLTTAENDSIAGLRTFTPQTHAQNNAGATMTVEAYAGTANGKAVNELKQDVQSEISALKITQSATLTLTTAGWANNAQTITYAHDTAKRNVIDVEPSSIEEWANCGVLATSETASGITFSCKTVPENALNFRVTSMGVN